MLGKFYGIGIGPGDSELLTIKAVRILNEADIIVSPVGKKGNESIAHSIAKPHIKSDANILNLTFPMVYDPEDLNSKWIENARIIESELKVGNNVAFITLGDPMLYSTYMYVMELLQDKGIEIETVPGINSFSAIASLTNIPLTAGNETLCVIPLRNDCSRVREALMQFDNIVVMKPSQCSKELAQILIENGLEKSFVMVSKAGNEGQEISYDINRLLTGDVEYLTIILIKKNGL